MELLRQPERAISSLALTDRLVGTTGAASPAVASSGSVGPGDGSELDAVEATVAEIWSGVLGVPVVSRDADFFELGGHSLLATRVVALVRRQLAPSASIRMLFDHSRLGEFAARLEVGESGRQLPVDPATSA